MAACLQWCSDSWVCLLRGCRCFLEGGDEWWSPVSGLRGSHSYNISCTARVAITLGDQQALSLHVAGYVMGCLKNRCKYTIFCTKWSHCNSTVPQIQFPAQSFPSSGPLNQASCTALGGLEQAPQ